MSPQKRRSLDDAIAASFVYGGDTATRDTSPSPTPQPDIPQVDKKNIWDC
jgi:hypothetical protein